MNDARHKEVQRALTLIGEAKGILELALSQEQDDLDLCRTSIADEMREEHRRRLLGE